MRDDPLKPAGYAESKVWARQKYSEDLVIPNAVARESGGSGGGTPSMFKSNSLSGNERNRLFVQAGDNYEDLTLLSGADFLADGRGFAWTDFDEDGFLDMVVTSLDVPRIRFLRNRCGDLGAENRMLSLRLRGAGDAAVADTLRSNRDGIGARVLVRYPSGRPLALHKQCGEGFSVQNSGVLRVPAGEDDFPVRIEVRWPSGRTSEVVPRRDQLVYDLHEPVDHARE